MARTFPVLLSLVSPSFCRTRLLDDKRGSSCPLKTPTTQLYKTQHEAWGACRFAGGEGSCQQKAFRFPATSQHVQLGQAGIGTDRAEASTDWNSCVKGTMLQLVSLVSALPCCWGEFCTLWLIPKDGNFGSSQDYHMVWLPSGTVYIAFKTLRTFLLLNIQQVRTQVHSSVTGQYFLPTFHNVYSFYKYFIE